MLDADGTARMLLHVAARIIESKQLLTDADKMGDGDHGVGMARGFKAVVEKLRTTAFSEPADVFKATGLAIMSSAGGASGAVLGVCLVLAVGALLHRAGDASQEGSSA